MAMSVNTLNILNYLKKTTAAGQDVTATDVAEALGVDVKVVNGAFTSGIQRKELGERIPAEIELEDGTHKGVKLLRLTEKGMAYTGEDETEAE